MRQTWHFLRRWPCPSTRFLSRAVWLKRDPCPVLSFSYSHARSITSAALCKSEPTSNQNLEIDVPASKDTKPQINTNGLRLLFFGSDDFSVAALKTIYQAREELGIDSIDVVCRPGKRYGRGLKRISEVPVRKIAEELQLPVHETDSLENWEAPVPEGGPINLLLAVSFGLLIPGRLITGARYGGLNLHPSRLPDLRGAAPLQNALLMRRKEIAVTLQTLHPTKFDHGDIISQTESLEIPKEIRESCSPLHLREWVTPMAMNLLKEGLLNRLYVPPVKDVGYSPDNKDVFPDGIVPARKLTKEDGHVDWKTWPSEKILARQRVLGSVWNYVHVEPGDRNGEERITDGKPVRLKFTDMADYTNNKVGPGTKSMRRNPEEPLPPGSVEVIVQIAKSKLGIWTCDKRFLWVKDLVLEGVTTAKDPVVAMSRLKMGHQSQWKDKLTLA